jgi:hypothetical protein
MTLKRKNQDPFETKYKENESMKKSMKHINYFPNRWNIIHKPEMYSKWSDIIGIINKMLDTFDIFSSSSI